MPLLPSKITNTALSVAGQAAGLGFKLAQQGLGQLNRLRSGRSDDDRVSAVAPEAPAEATPVRHEVESETKATVAPAPPEKTTRAGRFSRDVASPKRAKALRHRNVTASHTEGPAQVEGAKGHGGRPATVKAENTPSELAGAKKGRQAAPMGSTDDTTP